MRSNKVKILFCGHDLKFIRPLISYLSINDSYELRIIEHTGHYLNDENDAALALQWADLIFCEWALGNAVWFAQHKREHQVLVVRLHLQEVQARDRIDFIWQTDWSKVDRLIVITEHIYDWMLAEFPSLAGIATLVYNPIPAKSDYAIGKNLDSRFTLGFVGAVPARKRIDLAFDVLRILRESDPRFVLRVKGNLPRDYPWMSQRKDELRWYDNTFRNSADLIEQGAVKFDGHGPDMAAWYREIGHILSLSDFEGSHQAVAEGMAAGCIPAIRDWTGANRIYPAKYVRSTIAEIAELILAETDHQKYTDASISCRAFAQRFDNTVICSKLESIIQRELTQKNRDLKLSASVMHVLPTITIIAYVPLGNRGGYRIRVEQEIRQFVQHGCKIHLLCLMPLRHRGNGAQMDGDIYIAECEKHKLSFSTLGCTVHLVEIDDFFRMDVDNSSFVAETDQMLNIIRKSGSEVIHAEALYCARIAEILHQTLPELIFSIDWHGIVPEETKMSGAHQARINALELSERRLLTKCHLNVFVSGAMKHHYVTKYNLNLPDSIVVPCCVSEDRLVDIRKDTEYRDKKIVFGYAGTMADWQCGREMISLFARLYRHDDQCHFMLLIPSADQAKVSRYAIEFGLPEGSYTMTEVAHELVAAHLSRCDVGTLIRLDDPVNFVSSPTKFGEYLAAGIPLLMTDQVGDFSTIAREGSVSFSLSPSAVQNCFSSVSENDLDKIINFAKHARANKSELARRCQAIVREHLDWNNAIRPWIEAYQHQLRSN